MHSAEEWLAMAPVIKKLYVEEHRKLNDVMVIMERQYGFKATEQMYKKRFTAWGLSKNRKRVPRAATGPDGLKVQQYNRTGLMRTTAPGEYFLTLDKELLGHYPAETALYSVAAWANGNFDGTHWLQTNKQLSLWSASANGPATYPSTQMFQDIALSQALLERRQGRLAGLAVRKAFWQLEEVIKIGDPALLRNLVDIVFQMIQMKHDTLLRMLLSQLTSLANHHLPSLHPLVQFFRQIDKSNNDLAILIKMAFRCFVENFHQRMNDNFYWMYDNWVWDSSIRIIDSDPEGDYKRIMEAFQALALNTEAVESSQVLRSHLGFLTKTRLMRSDGFEKTSATDVLKILNQEEDELDAAAIPKDPRVHVYMRTAAIKRAIDKQDWDKVSETMQSNIKRLEMIYGFESREVIRELWSLEKVMRKAGNVEEADKIEKDALRRIGVYLSEVPGYMQ
ncbi:hypothetical protein PFICI_11171 [Pestalotiopsis fici W106-1]|uniref:Clr5 domain-containing protein n=1 Tax=Pestalotiopsis fici (strain W106-1 / CGMCC3.15140) TaxID=1229662 RepID=W3WW13_PESFW|nr:uncharacterized protein PFICI_11171 [Pestalotiopsis fici W106-1]ETS77297.1 hypothetical protein PFICI_11171 [Pestalotiopsis fici W106-1]